MSRRMPLSALTRANPGSRPGSPVVRIAALPGRPGLGSAQTECPVGPDSEPSRAKMAGLGSRTRVGPSSGRTAVTVTAGIGSGPEPPAADWDHARRMSEPVAACIRVASYMISYMIS